MKKEIFRMIIPSNKMINDNVANNYRAHMGKLKYLTQMAKLMINGGYEGPCRFKVPSKEEVQKLITKDGRYSLILEIWKNSQRFDVQNYSMTYKPLIDVFSSAGYWEDDNWKFLNPVIINGGDNKVWKERAYRYDGDNLPDDIGPKFWESEKYDAKDTLVRIIITDKLDI